MAFNLARSNSTSLVDMSVIKFSLVARFIKAQFPNAPTEKVVDVVIAAAVSCLEMLVDHGRVTLRRNVGVCAAPVGLLDPRHIPDDAHDLTCADRRVRSAGVCLVLLEVVPEHAKRFVQRVRPSGEYRRCDIREFVKIKQKLSASFVGVGGAERGSGSVPLYPYTVYFLLLFLLLLLYHMPPYGTIRNHMVISHWIWAARPVPQKLRGSDIAPRLPPCPA